MRARELKSFISCLLSIVHPLWDTHTTAHLLLLLTNTDAVKL